MWSVDIIEALKSWSKWLLIDSIESDGEGNIVVKTTNCRRYKYIEKQWYLYDEQKHEYVLSE